METRRYIAAIQRLVQKSGCGWYGRFAPVDGELVHYVEGGDRQGRPLVLLHGFGAWSYTWRYNLHSLGPGIRALAPDLRGFGLTTKPPRGGYNLWDQARLVLRFLDALGLERAVVGGNSLGGEISLRLALLAPQRLQGLLLVSSAGYVDMTLPPLARAAVHAPGLGPPLARLVWANRRFIGAVLRAAYYRAEEVTPEAVAGYSLPALTPGAARALLGMLHEMDPGATAHRGEVRLPALLIWGAHDPWTPLSHGERMSRELGGAPLKVLAQAAHLPHEERPADFAAVAAPWLRQVW